LDSEGLKLKQFIAKPVIIHKFDGFMCFAKTLFSLAYWIGNRSA
jgi:hypothetical protein